MKRLVALAVAAASLQARPAAADLVDLKWSTEGYFRTRTVYLTNLAPQPTTTLTDPNTGDDIVMGPIRRTSYIYERLRIMPSVSYAKLASLNFQVDALDDVLWGDNNGVASAPLFATESSNQHFLGGNKVGDSVTIPRAWVQFNVPVGLMRVGRQPSHWGMGLLANGGGTGNLDTLTPPPPGEPDRPAQDHFFDDDFGDNHFGSTADRVLFVTRPLSIYRTITKAKNKESKFVIGYAFDKLAESPFLAAEPQETKYRPFGQQGFLSRGGDDVDEHVVLAVYSDPDWDQVRYTDQLRVGIYTVLRTSKRGSTFPSDIPELVSDGSNCSGAMEDPDEFVPCVDTGSKVYIADLWWKLRYGPWYSEGELIHIRGKTFGGVPFPSKNQSKKANINSGAVRFGYLADLYDGILEIGHAGGDGWLEDGTLRQRASHADYNVGLILFEEILREQTARAFLTFISVENPEGAQGLMSRGGVINANYLHPKVRWRPGLPGVELVGALLMAWADELPVTGVNGFYLPTVKAGESGKLLPQTGSYYGTEVDLALKASFSGKMLFSLETGYLLYGDALKAKLTRADGSFTLQTRIAFMW